MEIVKWFEEIGKADVNKAGGKGANLGELVKAGLPVPPGFVVTAQAYQLFTTVSELSQKLSHSIEGLDVDDTSSYGPEVTTITTKLAGTYRFCVFNFSGQSSHPIESSSAVVGAIIGGNYYQWTVPTSNPNNYSTWRVCDITVDASGNVSVSTLNDFANGSKTATDPGVFNPSGSTGLPDSMGKLSVMDVKK